MALKLGKKQNKVKKVIKKTAAASPAQRDSRSKVDAGVTMPTGEFTEAIGRRKVATARVRLYESAGDFVVNGKLAGEYFRSLAGASQRYSEPFELTNTKGKYVFTAKVEGSGISAQLEAVIHGIARALVKLNPENRPFLKEAGMLTRDPRMKETRKPGRGGKARRKRQSPKR